MTALPPIVEFQGVSVRFGSFAALSDVTFTLED